MARDVDRVRAAPDSTLGIQNSKIWIRNLARKSEQPRQEQIESSSLQCSCLTSSSNLQHAIGSRSVAHCRSLGTG
jgi:hypothetical protein